VNNCVGERNYGSFSAFLFSIMGLIGAVITSLILMAVGARGGDESSNTVMWVVLVIVAVFSVGMCGVMGSFSIYHCFLICSGQTTKENLKKNADHKDKGRTLACCGCRPPSEINPREMVQVGARMKSASASGMAINSKQNPTAVSSLPPLVTGKAATNVVAADDNV
jgi:hypothetical protein